MNAIAQVSAAPLTGPKLDNRRVLAGVVDLLIVIAGALVILYAGDSLTGDRQGALGAVVLGWALYYYFALESGAGQTVGKKLMKLRVVRADGSPAGMREIAVRTILRVVDGIGLYIVGLIVMLVTGERRQRTGDLAAGTIVVDASGPATAVAEPAGVEALDEDDDADDVVAEEPVAEAAPTNTITLPSRPQRPETLEDIAEEPAEDAEPEPVAETEPVVEAEPVVDVEPDEPVAEDPVVEVEPVVEEPVVEEPVVEEPVVEEPVVEEPVVEEPVADADPVVASEPVPVPVADEPVADAGLPPAASPSIQALAADVAAAQEAGDADEAPESDEEVNVKSVETVSAMDLIMGAAEEDSAKQDEDDAPASA